MSIAKWGRSFEPSGEIRIIVNSRNIFCLGWKSDRSLATQNKKDDLSDNLDNIRDNLKQLFFYTTIRFATKKCKVLFISHGRTRIDTDTRNIYILLLAALEKSYKILWARKTRPTCSAINCHRSLFRHYANAMTNHRFATKAHWILCKYSNIRLWLVCEMRIDAFVKIAGERCLRGPRKFLIFGDRRNCSNLNEQSEFIVACMFRRSVRQLISENQVLLPRGRSGGSKIYKISARRARRYISPTDEHGWTQIRRITV